jgi:hypothetical protein
VRKGLLRKIAQLCSQRSSLVVASLAVSVVLSLDSMVCGEQSDDCRGVEVEMAGNTRDQADSVRSAKEALRLMRLADRLSASASVLGEAANAIHVAAALVLGTGGLQDAPQEDPGDDPTKNVLVNEQDIDFIKELINEQNKAGGSFAGCQNAYREAVDAALETTAPGTAMRNKMMTGALLAYIHCLRLPKPLALGQGEPGE